MLLSSVRIFPLGVTNFSLSRLISVQLLYRYISNFLILFCAFSVMTFAYFVETIFVRKFQAEI